MKSYDFAHEIWEQFVKKGDTLIDATIGNGHDTLFLAKLLNGQGKIFGYDIQKQAINNTKLLLQTELSEKEGAIVTLYHQSHENFYEKEAKLIVYNLGYLPRGDKNLTTNVETTIKSLKSALKILQNGGLISILCYVGHPMGKKEFDALNTFFNTIPKNFILTEHHWINRLNAPVLFLVQNDLRVL